MGKTTHDDVKDKPYLIPVDSDDGFWLSDLFASAFLVAEDHRVGSIHHVGSGRWAFAFVEDETLRADYDRFQRDQPMQNFIGAIHFLKRMLIENDFKRKR